MLFLIFLVFTVYYLMISGLNLNYILLGVSIFLPVQMGPKSGTSCDSVLLDCTLKTSHQQAVRC
jgi:hypothetical protein